MSCWLAPYPNVCLLTPAPSPPGPLFPSHMSSCPSVHLHLPFSPICEHGNVLQELTLSHPNIVNAKKNMELLYSEPTFLAAHR